MDASVKKSAAELFADLAESVTLWDFVPEGHVALTVVSDQGVVGFSADIETEDGEILMAELLRFFTPKGGEFHFIKDGADVEELVNAFTTTLEEYVGAEDPPEMPPEEGGEGFDAAEAEYERGDGVSQEAPRRPVRHRTGGWVAIGDPEGGYVSLARQDEYAGDTITPARALELAEDLRRAAQLAEDNPPVRSDPVEEEGGPDGDV